MSSKVQQVLPDAMLARFRERAGGYDESNSFPNEDLQELRESGYLRALVPVSYTHLTLPTIYSV